MASLKKKKSGEGGANWMDTYGDMVTLLLCFFVLLYSMSTIDQEKWMLIVQSFNKDAMVSIDDTPRGPEGDNDDEAGGGMPATTEMDSALEELYEFLQTMAAAQAEDTVSVSQGDGYVFISFSNALFFEGDRSRLLQPGKDVLNSILPALEEAAPYIDEIRISGHTATALSGRYDVRHDRTLASDRANEVLVYLLENSDKLDPARLISLGYGQWRPVAGNDLESDRSKNRRVEMMITGKNLEDALSDSIVQYYTSTNQTRPGQESG